MGLEVIISMALAAVGIWNILRMDLTHDEIAESLASDSFGVSTFSVIRKKYGLLGITKTYGFIAGGFTAAFIPILVKIFQ